MTTNTGYTVSNGNYTNNPDLSTIFKPITNGTNPASPTGYKVSNDDLSYFFEPYNGGFQAPTTGYTASNGEDLSSIFAPNLYTVTSNTNINITYIVSDKVNVIIFEHTSPTDTSNATCNITFNLEYLGISFIKF